MSRRFHYDKMTAKQLRAALDQHEMEPMTFARLTGADPRTVQRWLDPREPDQSIPHWATVVLTLWELPQAIARTRTLAANMIREDANSPGIAYPFLDEQGRRRKT